MPGRGRGGGGRAERATARRARGARGARGAWGAGAGRARLRVRPAGSHSEDRLERLGESGVRGRGLHPLLVGAAQGHQPPSRALRGSGADL